MIDKNILSELAAFTDADEHTEFRLLRTWQDYLFAKKVCRSIKALTLGLRSIANKQYKNYCRSVILGVSDVNKLLAYKYLIKILDFYMEELRINKEVIYEYELYLSDGNWLDFVLDNQRTQDKLWDHRGK